MARVARRDLSLTIFSPLCSGLSAVPDSHERRNHSIYSRSGPLVRMALGAYEGLWRRALARALLLTTNILPPSNLPSLLTPTPASRTSSTSSPFGKSTDV